MSALTLAAFGKPLYKGASLTVCKPALTSDNLFDLVHLAPLPIAAPPTSAGLHPSQQTAVLDSKGEVDLTQPLYLRSIVCKVSDASGWLAPLSKLQR